MTGEAMTWIAPVYLHLLVERAAANPDPPEDVALTNEALQYARKALDGEVPAPEARPGPAAEERPPGIWARVELPGWRNHTGWITEEMRFGTAAAVVRDWDGREVAVVYPGPACQVLPLPTPLKRPEPQTALSGPGPRPAFADVDDDPWAGQDDDEKDPF